jgi:hypothetical protein
LEIAQKVEFQPVRHPLEFYERSGRGAIGEDTFRPPNKPKSASVSADNESGESLVPVETEIALNLGNILCCVLCGALIYFLP